MDPTTHWIMNRRKPSDQKAPLFTPNITVGRGGSSSVSYYESWEERAFAEDSAGHLGGCIWPPRSYSCSFCSREFRSAQALGGHMNVHRRDRARLKLSGLADDGGSDNQIVADHQSYMIQPCPSQITALQTAAYGVKASAPILDTNPNPVCSVLPYPSRSYVQDATARTVWGKQVLRAYNDNGKKDMFLDAAQLPQDHQRPAARMGSNTELHVGRGELKLMSILGCRTRRDFEASDDEENFQVSCKRRRIDLDASPLVVCSSSRKLQQYDKYDGDDKPNGAKVLKLCPSSSVEELDLELRLGEVPKVK